MAAISQRPHSSPDSSMSCMSVEQERDSYKEKVEHLKLLIKQYQQELQSQKIKKDGVETVSKLLQESKQENMSLLRKIKTLETAVKNLQNRLTSNGLSGSLNIEETDMFVHGTSKQLLDNLAKENSRLRTLLKSASMDPEEVQSLHQTIKDQANQIDELSGENLQQRSRVVELERVMGSSDSDKDSEISRLRRQVQEMKESSRTREVLCTSLAEETHNLRQQLHDVAVHCQQMALKLEQSNKDSAKNSLKSDYHTAKDGVTPQTDVSRLKEENYELKNQLEEVTKMNHRWQAYNNNMEQRMRELMEELEHSRAYSVPPERTESINRALEEAKNKLRSLEQQKQQLERELEEKKELILLQSQEMEKLRGELDNSQQGSRLSSNAEIIEALKAQIQICTEDFESERKDREKAQARISQLEADLEQIRRERDALCRNRQQHVNVDKHFLTNQGMYNDFNLTPLANQIHPSDTQLAARGPSQPSMLTAAERFNEVDGALQTDAEPHSGISDDKQTGSKPREQSPILRDKQTDNTTRETRSNSDTDFGLSATVPALNDLEDDQGDMELRPHTKGARKNSQVLMCPKCGREFVTDQHTDLLEHLELCCD